jgi:hypothetical protein
MGKIIRYIAPSAGMIVLIIMFFHTASAFKGFYYGLFITGGVFAYFGIQSFLKSWEKISTPCYDKCGFGIQVTLYMKEILNHPSLKDKNLLPVFSKNYDSDLKRGFGYEGYEECFRVDFIVKDDLIFVNGKLTPWTGLSIKLPYEKENVNIIVGIQNGELNCYVPKIPFGSDEIPLFSFPLAYVSCEYNFHPDAISSKEALEEYHSFAGDYFKNEGYDEKEHHQLLLEHREYNSLRIWHLTKWYDCCKSKRWKKFIGRKEQALIASNFSQVDTWDSVHNYRTDTDDIYRHEYGEIRIRDLDYGLSDK